MIEALPNLESVYAKWEKKNPYVQNGKLPKQPNGLSANGYDVMVAKGRESWKARFADVPAPLRSKATRRSQGNKKTRDASLFDFSVNCTLGASYKSTPSYHASTGRQRPYAGLCCACMPDSRNYLFTESIRSSGVTDVLRVNTSTADNDWLTRTFCHISFVLRKRLEHRYPDLTLAVLTSPRLLEAIQTTVQEESGFADAPKISSIQRRQESRAKSMLLKMSAQISNRLIRFTGWFLHKLLGRLLSSIVIHRGQMTLLQQFCKQEVPVIFLPTHRSHLDYILLTFVLFNYDLKAPYVAAGDNLLIPFFGSLMRGLGGFFIRRKLDKCSEKKDRIYRSVLHSYMEELLRNNEYLEFFVEGGRTRSGKSVYPKGGLLSVVVDAFNNGVIPEAYLVPVTISYDKLVDGNFIKEQLGEPKVYETFWRAVHAIYKVLMGQYGMVRLDFAQPFSLKEYMQVAKTYPSSVSRTLREKSSELDTLSSDVQSVESKISSLKPSMSNTSMVVEEKEMRHIVQSLAEHVIYASLSAQSILSTHLLAFILLNQFRQGADLAVVTTTFECLQSEILSRGHDISFTGETDVVLQHAQALLGDRLVRKVVVEKSKGAEAEKVFTTKLVPVTALPEVLELSYYANVVSPLFATESVLVNTIYSIVGFEDWTNLTSKTQVTFSQHKLMEEAAVLCSILKYEYIFCPPCQTLDTVLKTGFDRLRNNSLLITDEPVVKDSNIDVKELMWAKRFARQTYLDEQDSDSSEDWITDTQICKVNCEPDSLTKFWFFKRVLSPILETYYVASCHLLQLLKNDIPENDFCKSLHKILKERVATGTASYAESVALDTLKNAVRGLENVGVIHCYSTASVAMIGLTEQYNSEELMFSFIRRLESYRE